MTRRTREIRTARNPAAALKPLAALACLSFLALAAAGCDPGGEPIARVGGDVITRGDFESAALSNGRQYLQFGEGAPDTLLEALIERQLMIVAAKHGGAYLDTAFLDYARSIREQAAREAMVREMGGAGTVPASDAEARALWERRGTEAHVRILFAPSEQIAREAERQLQAGGDFVAVSARFNPPSAVPRGGDLGWVAPGNLLPAIDRQVLDAPLMKVVGPIASPGQGWFFVRIEGRRAVARPPFEQGHGELVMAISQRKQRAYLIDQVQRLKQGWDLVLAPDAAQTLTGPARAVLAGRPPGDKSPLPPLDPTRAGTVLATWRGGELTLGDAWNDLGRHNSPSPNLEMQSLVENWIEGRALDRIVLAEAEARHLVEEPDVARAIRGRQENYLLDGFYNREVMSRVQVDEAALRDRFERHREEYEMLTAAEVRTLVVTDSVRLDAMVMHMGHAGNLDQLAGMIGAALDVRTEHLRFPSDDLAWQSLAVEIRRMRAGEMAGPYQIAGGYRVFELVSKEQHVPAWEELDANAHQQLQNQVVAEQREARYRALADSLRRAIPVTIDHAALRRAPWPSATTLIGPGGGS